MESLAIDIEDKFVAMLSITFYNFSKYLNVSWLSNICYINDIRIAVSR